MSKVIKFEDINKGNEDKNKVNGREVENTQGYYIDMDWVRVDFGGALLRDLSSKIVGNRESYIKLYQNNLAYSIEGVKNSGASKWEIDMLETVFKESTEGMIDLLNSIQSEWDIDDIFDGDSGTLFRMSQILLMVLVTSYTPFDYHRMQKDNWLMMSVSVEDFMGHEDYKYIKQMSKLG